MTKTVRNVLAIRPEESQFTFVTEEQAANIQDQGVILVRVAEDLEALSGPQSVALYNEVLTQTSSHHAPVKRFSDKTAAAKRLWAVFQDLAIKRQHEEDEAAETGQPVPAPIPPAVQKKLDEAHARSNKLIGDAIANNPELAKIATVQPAADKARDRAKPAKATDTPAPKARKSAGINLAPLKKVYACRAGTKQAKLIDLLSRPQGATFKELHAAMTSPEFAHLKPWAEVTTRSALGWDVHHVKGYGVRTTKRENGEDCYRLTYPAGMNAPLPHQPRKTKEG